MSWSDRLPAPIPLPGGRELVTLEDAARYIQKLPKAQHDLPHWRHAVEHLLRASADSVDVDAWLVFAEMFMLKALHHGNPPPEKEPRRKAVKRFNIIPSDQRKKAPADPPKRARRSG